MPRARARLSCRRSLAEEVHIETTLFFGFAQRRDFRFFIQFDVPAKRKPFAELPVMNQQNFAVLDDKDRDGEVDCVMNVRH